MEDPLKLKLMLSLRVLDLGLLIWIYLRGNWVGIGFMGRVVGLWVKKKGQTGS